MKYSLLIGLFLAAPIFGGSALASAQTIDYDPDINPSEFTTAITNKYFSLPVGLKLTYEGETEDGTERVEIEITGDTKEIMGVMTLVYRDRVWVGNELVEDTRDYLAQHENGDVWYFGEDVDNYEDGELSDHDGSWHAGVDGAKPGIWVKQNPVVGETYRQEYYSGEAEDMAEVLSLTENVSVSYGSFVNCLKTKDWNPFEPGVYEHKYYCPDARTLVLEENPIENGRVELLTREVASSPATGGNIYLYVDKRDEVRSVHAASAAEALRTAPEIALRSGVILAVDGKTTL